MKMEYLTFALDKNGTIRLLTSTVYGHLDLGGCRSLWGLPDGLNVGGSLDLHGCTSLTRLPDGLSVGRHLFLDDCTGLTELPKGLHVGGTLFLTNCTGLDGLPKGLCAREVFCIGCKRCVQEEARVMFGKRAWVEKSVAV